MKLDFTIGAEISALPKQNYFDFDRDSVDYKTRCFLQANSLLMAYDLQKFYPSIETDKFKYTDGHCIEFQSPVFDNTTDPTIFFNRLNNIFKDYNFTAQRQDTVCGGLHFHVGFNHLDNSERFEMIRGLMRDSIMNPFIPWVFLCPDDIESGNNDFLTSRSLESRRIQRKNQPIEKEEPIDYMLFSLQPDQSYLSWTGTEYPSILILCDEHKSNWFTVNNPDREGNNFTFEFRCFSAARNLKEFKDCMDFVVAYTNYVCSQTKKGQYTKVKLTTLAKLQKLTFKHCEKEFNKLLVKIGLEPRRYAKYVNTNLRGRFKKGYSRL